MGGGIWFHVSQLANLFNVLRPKIALFLFFVSRLVRKLGEFEIFRLGNIELSGLTLLHSTRAMY